MAKNTITHLPELQTTTPQTQPADERQIQNHAGGYSFAVDHWTQARRWLVLGTEGGTFYQDESELTIKNARAFGRCLNEDAQRAIGLILEVSDGGYAVRNDAALMALAMAVTPRYNPDAVLRASAIAAIPSIVRTGTMLFQFVDTLRQLKRSGRAIRRAIQNWYETRGISAASYQVVKYPSRNGWSHGDVLRLFHPTFKDDEINALARYIITGDVQVRERTVKRNNRAESITYPANTKIIPTALVQMREYFRTVSPDDSAEILQQIVKLISDNGVPREALPTAYLNNTAIWSALLENMPYAAMIRNLGIMSKIGLLGMDESPAAKTIVKRLTNQQALQRARIHPLTIYKALDTYASGQGHKGRNTWQPNPEILQALVTAFDLSFKLAQPITAKLLIAVDVSGSMDMIVTGGDGLKIAATEGAAFMARALAASARNYHAVGFNTTVHALDISPTRRVDDITRAIARIGGGGTNISLPLEWATQHHMDVDCFVILTDNETWAGKQHPHQALLKYRQQINPQAKVAILNMAANNLTSVPDDMGVIQLAGLDSSIVSALDAFLRNHI